jgi:hypothetical protein
MQAENGTVMQRKGTKGVRDEYRKEINFHEQLNLSASHIPA